MGTRGFVGFVVDGKEKIGYNQFDSYPAGIGKEILDWLRLASQDPFGFLEKVEKLRVVTQDTPPTAEDIKRLKKYSNTNVSTQDLSEWYVLLRETQGNPGMILDAGVVEDASNFPLDSLFAEWGYIIDVDSGTFEVYEGFQKCPHNEGRFSNRPPLNGEYYPVKLVASWPLSELPTDEELLALENDEDDE